jgi:hypothetical protein
VENEIEVRAIVGMENHGNDGDEDAIKSDEEEETEDLEQELADRAERASAMEEEYNEALKDIAEMGSEEEKATTVTIADKAHRAQIHEETEMRRIQVLINHRSQITLIEHARAHHKMQAEIDQRAVGFQEEEMRDHRGTEYQIVKKNKDLLLLEAHDIYEGEISLIKKVQGTALQEVHKLMLKDAETVHHQALAAIEQAQSGQTREEKTPIGHTGERHEPALIGRSERRSG